MFATTLNTSYTWNNYAEKSDKASKAFTKGNFWPSGKTLGGFVNIIEIIFKSLVIFSKITDQVQ